MKKSKINNPLTVKGKNGLPKLINPLHIERAIAKLYEYESTGVLATDILELNETIEKLKCRIKSLEQW